MLRYCLAALLITTPIALQAQSLSVADIMKQADAKVSSHNDYLALLADPDPVRSRAAMEVMTASGDPELMRIALSAGLYSPNPVVQRTAVEAFLRTGPVLGLSIDFSAVDVGYHQGYRSEFAKAGGSAGQGGQAYLPLEIGPYSEALDCYTVPGKEECRARITDDHVSLKVWSRWNMFRLNDQGQLVGTLTVYSNHSGQPAIIAIAN